MLRIFLISVLMVGTFLVADSNYNIDRDIKSVNYQNKNDILKLKLEIYQLKEKNLKLQKIIDNLKMTNEEREAFKRKEAIKDFRRQLRNNRLNHKVSLSY